MVVGRIACLTWNWPKGVIMLIALTDHARMRMQQRGIPHSQIEWLLEFGSERYDRCGKLWLSYDHKAKRLMRKCLSSDILKRIKLDTYGVLSEENGVLVTVGHRTKRFNRH